MTNLNHCLLHMRVNVIAMSVAVCLIFWFWMDISVIVREVKVFEVDG